MSDYDGGGAVAGTAGALMFNQLMANGIHEVTWQQRVFAMGLLFAVVVFIIVAAVIGSGIAARRHDANRAAKAKAFGDKMAGK